MNIHVDTFNELELAEDELSFDTLEQSKLSNIRRRLFRDMPVYAGYFLILDEKQYKKFYELTGVDHYNYKDYLERLRVLYPIELLQRRKIIENGNPALQFIKNSLDTFAFKLNTDYTQKALRLNANRVLELMEAKRIDYNIMKSMGVKVDDYHSYFPWDSPHITLTHLLDYFFKN